MVKSSLNSARGVVAAFAKLININKTKKQETTNKCNKREES